MKYGTVKRLWEMFGTGEYGVLSFDMFLYTLSVNRIITLKQYDKFLKKFEKECKQLEEQLNEKQN